MRNLIPGLLFAGFTLALSSPHVGQAAGVKSGSANPAPPVIQVPQTPPPPILNPGVTPGAPGPGDRPRDQHLPRLLGPILAFLSISWKAPFARAGDAIPSLRLPGRVVRRTLQRSHAETQCVIR